MSNTDYQMPSASSMEPKMMRLLEGFLDEFLVNENPAATTQKDAVQIGRMHNKGIQSKGLSRHSIKLLCHVSIHLLPKITRFEHVDFTKYQTTWRANHIH
ncbi:hypothetical protein QQP08_023899 [Theobroma cacao]|nr:hypothetical protein QQP08_023899 [Theobroma cacao]